MLEITIEVGDSESETGIIGKATIPQGCDAAEATKFVEDFVSLIKTAKRKLIETPPPSGM